MTKKIQHFLLLNHPLLWNLKVIPTMLCTIVLNVCFFAIGYFTTSTNFFEEYNWLPVGSFFSYLIALIAILLTLVIWLICYSKNNAFRSIYPKRAKSLYTEWILIFFIVLSALLYPMSLYQGTQAKYRTVASKSETEQILNMLDMVKVFIPTDMRCYGASYPPVMFNKDKSDDLYSQTDDLFANSGALSLLDYNCYQSDTNDSIMNNWLQSQQKQKISSLMDSFLELAHKHSLETKLTKDQWMSMMYNPPHYILYESLPASAMPYDELKTSYERIAKAYDPNIAIILFTIATLALSVSTLIFGYRVTSGKSWLIAVVSQGIICLICMFVIAFFSFNALIFSISILTIIVVELVFILKKIERGSKGNSSICINHILFIIPYIVCLISLTISRDDNENLFISDSDIVLMSNFVFTLICIFLFLRCVLLKWKSLPEE